MNPRDLLTRHPLRRLQLALIAVGEIAWLYGWSSGLGHCVPGTLNVPLLGVAQVAGTLIAGLLATSLLVRTGLSLRKVRLALACLGLAAGAALALVPNWPVAVDALGRVIPTGGLAVLMWWRGMTLGSARLGTDDVRGRFRTSVVALAALLVMDVFAKGSQALSSEALVASALVVVFTGLVGLPLANVVELGEANRSGSPGAINAHWLGMLVGTVGLLVALTLVLTGILSFDTLEALSRPLGTALNAVLTVLIYVIAVPVGFVMQWLIYFLRLLLHLGSHQNPPRRPNLGWLRQLQEHQHAHNALLAQWLPVLRWVALGVAVVVVGLVLARAVSRLGEWRTRDNVLEVRDFVWSWREFVAAVLRWLRRLLGRARPVTRRAGGSASGVQEEGPLGIRGLYRELLRIGSSIGHRRAPSQTPLEYERVLATSPALAPRSDALDVLTRLYVRHRYGPEEASEDSLREAREALGRIRDRDGEEQTDPNP